MNLVPSCKLCLEIGTGPVLVLSTYASRKCENIILSEYNLKCFELVR